MLTVQYARELREHGFLVNLADPGLTDTDFARNADRTTGRSATRPAAQGARVAVRLATLGPNEPTGGFFNEEGTVPW